MMPRLLPCAFLVVLTQLASPGSYRPGPPADQPIAVVHATLIDGTGSSAVPDSAVVIEKDRIVAAGPMAQVTIPSGARMIDATGKAVMPGLVDSHVHLTGGWDGVSSDYLGFRRFLESFLYAGVTTVLDCGNTLAYVTQLKQEIAAGRLQGPRIYAVGPLIDGPDEFWIGITEPLVSIAQIPGLVKFLKENNVDFLKAYAGLSDREFRALAVEAHQDGLRVIADGHEINGTWTLVTTGIDAVAHITSNRMTDETIAEMARRKMANMTTLVGFDESRRLANLGFLDQPLIKDVVAPYYVEALRQAVQAGRFKRRTPPSGDPLATSFDNLRRLWKAGILVVAGTDAPYPGIFYGESLHRELELLVEAGLTPVQAIQAATGNAAKFLDGDGADWGTIAPGKRADLLIVAGAPQTRIAESRRIDTVIQGGRILDRSALKVRPDEPAYRPSGDQTGPFSGRRPH